MSTISSEVIVHLGHTIRVLGIFQEHSLMVWHKLSVFQIDRIRFLAWCLIPQSGIISLRSIFF